MPIGYGGVPIAEYDQLAHWPIAASYVQAVMRGPFPGHHVNRHYWARQLREALVEEVQP